MESDPLAVESDQLRRLVDELEENRGEAEALAGHLDAAQLRWRPEPESWSVAEILNHLVQTGESYLPRIDRELERARQEDRRARGPFSRGLLGRWLVRGMEPPPGIRIPSPRDFLPGIGAGASAETESGEGTPPESEPAVTALPRFREHQERLIHRIREADGLDLEAMSVPFPVAPFLPINLFAGFAYLSAHQRRHLWQARRTVERMTSPGTSNV